MSGEIAVDSPGLPDFRNLGVVGRALVLAEFVNLVSLFGHSADGVEGLARLLDGGMAYELTLLLTLGVLALLSPLIQRCERRRGWAVIFAACAVVAVAVDFGVGLVLGEVVRAGTLKVVVVSISVAALLGIYFDWRHRALSPALIESRLAALQARIRPHFLFNSINAALAVLRADPRRAEAILLDMSDLFRVVLKESRSLVPLSSELDVARAYLDIEQVRLDGRLVVRWDIDGAPLDAQVPVLFLQPLLENAVWHGIEPLDGEGEIHIHLVRRGGRLEIEVSNPMPMTERSSGAGNKMALANIRERLALHYDEEASMTTGEVEGRFVVRIVLPITSAPKRAAGQH